jgi:thiamine-monophosphate kinase
MTVRLAEMEELSAWLGDQPRDPCQLHPPGECDAEVVPLAGGGHLATSVDTVAEEIATGLYSDPETIGWIAAMNGLSDIAAVGADPLGVLMSVMWGPDWDAADRAALGRGFGAALRVSGTCLLGGDTGNAPATVVTTTALGRCEGPPMARSGARPGDLLCVTGTFGSGGALAARWVLGENPEVFPERLFRPAARLREGVLLRPIASACTDTSDGLLQAVEILTGVSGVGAALEWNPDTLDAGAAAYFRARELPLWLLWVAEISEYELLVALPEEAWLAARRAVPSLRRIGVLTDDRETSVTVDGREISLDLSGLGDLARAPAEERANVAIELIAATRADGLP